ncbi:MAG: PAS domain S-box protein, partial [Fidelibacterota bacterium]
MSEKKNLVLPLTFYAILSIATIIIWWSFEKNTLEDFRSMSSVLSEQISLRIKDNFTHHIIGLNDLNREWKKIPVKTKEEYSSIAEEMMSDYGGFQAINFVDTSGTIIWVNPYLTNEGALGKSLYEHPDSSVIVAFTRAKETGTFQLTPPIPLFQGGIGYASYLPIIIDGEITGYINGVFKVKDIIEHCIKSGDIDKFVFYIDDGDEEVYRSSNANSDTAMEILGSFTFLAFEQFWSVYVALDPLFFKSFPSTISVIILLSGLFVSFVLSLLLRMVLIRRDQVIKTQIGFRHLVEEMAIGVIIIKEGKIVFVNKKAMDITGFSDDELQDDTFIDHVHRRHRPKLRKLYEEVEKNENSTEDIEIRFINKENREQWLWVNCLSFEWEDVRSIIHLIEDITTRKQSFQALEDKENQTRLLFENIPDGVVVSDKETILYANEAFKQIVGAKTTKDIINQPIKKFLHPEYETKMIDEQAKLLVKGDKIPFVEEKLIDFNGRIIPVEISVGLVEFMGKRSFQIFIRDISERKELIEEIQNNESKYRTLFDSSKNPMLMLKDDHFIDCNKMALELLNCSRDQVINATLFDFSPPHQPSGIDSKPAMISKIKTALADQEISFEWKLARADG